jgi:hypothetical protein
MMPQTTRKPIKNNNIRLISKIYVFWQRENEIMPIGYIRISKSDGSQDLDLQRDVT